MPKKIIYIVVSLFFCTSCAEPRIVEELGFMHSLGYELNEAENAKVDGVLIVTAAMPQVTPTAGEMREVLTTVAHTSKDARGKLARKTDRILVSGQLRTALFSMNLAREGILDTMDTLVRDPNIGLNLKVIVVNGSTKELLMEDYPQHPRTERYIYDLVDKEAKINGTVDTSLYEFIRDYYDDGIDPIVPVIKKGKGEVILDGVGLFRGDKLVLLVDPKEARIFKMLHGDYMGGDITTEIKLDKEKKESYLFITFSTIDTHRKIIVHSPTEITVQMNITGKIDEYTGHLSLAEDDVQRDIENKLGEIIEEVSLKIISKMQDNKSDNIGIGQFVRNSLSYGEWKEMKWKDEIYPTAKIKLDVNVKVKGFGSVK